MKKLDTYILLTITIIIVSFILFTFKLTESYIFHPDFARDIDDIQKILQGDITLIGPKLTFGGIYSGPYYYYLFVPILFITQRIDAVVLFNAFLFAIGLGYFFYVVSKQISIHRTLLVTTTLALSPLFLITSRNPSNAYTYLPFLLIFMTILLFQTPQRRSHILLFGFFGGFIATFHLVTGTVLLFLTIMYFFLLKNKKDIIWFIIGMGTAFTPLLLFELKHGFVMIKNTFIDKSYMSFVENSNIVGGLTGKEQFFENFMYIGTHMKEFIIFHPLVYFSGILIILNRQNKQKYASKQYLLTYALLASYSLLAATLKFQFINHYLFPVSFLILFTTIYQLLYAPRLPSYFLLTLLILAEIYMFPKNIYAESWRTYERYEQSVKYVVDKNFVSPDQSFNIIQITIPDMRHPWGYEYRSFFRKEGYKLDSELLYRDSGQLLIFSEDPAFDVKKLDTWEIKEFGIEHLKNAKSYKIADTKINLYIIKK